MTNNLASFSFFKNGTGESESGILRNPNKADMLVIQVDGGFTTISFELLGKINKESNEWHPIYLLDIGNPKASSNIITSKGLFTAMQIGLIKDLKIKVDSADGDYTIFGMLGE